jgi:hypothetical protein
LAGDPGREEERRFDKTIVPLFVMAGLVPAIHALLGETGVDARHKAGHDGERRMQNKEQQ